MRTIQDIPNLPPREMYTPRGAQEVHATLASALDYIAERIASPNAIVRVITVRISTELSEAPLDEMFLLAEARGYELYWDSRCDTYNVIRLHSKRPA